MLFRYWGDLHADVQQFAPLVDRIAGGIADTTLIAAIRDKGWTATRVDGSLAALREQLDAGRPVMLLIEDRPGRYHYVVAVGADAGKVVVHDPTWGPSRALSAEALDRAWQPTRSWMLVVTPGPAGVRREAVRAAVPVAAPRGAPTVCDRLLDEALDEIDARGLEVAEQALGAVRARCPASGAVARELAGVRFGQSRLKDATALAREALFADATDAYAWDVLGSSLFLQDDTMAALAAWNHIDRPTLDLVRIEGLTRARYAGIASLLGLAPNTLLSARAFGLASRRLADLPDRVSSRLTLEPAADGYATVTAAIQETSRAPTSLPAWGATAAKVAIDRQIDATIAGGLGQGEVWTGQWRWWEHRPRIAGGFSTPVEGRFGGVWRVEASWEAQTYAHGDGGLQSREERRSGTLTLGNWFTPDLRYEVRAGLDAWADGRRAVATGASLEQRFLRDRLAIAGGLDRWSGLAGSRGFATATASVRYRSALDPVGVVASGSVRLDIASAEAPLAFWSGAGEGRARPGLLRAHRLHHDGIIDGPVFGRRVAYSNLEVQRWFPTRVAPVGIAVFADLARAGERLRPVGEAFQVDSGVGLRARAPGLEGTLRLDYARGLRDGAQRVTVGWTTER